MLPHAGQVRKTNVYFSQQTRQDWQPAQGMEPGQDGGALWLPGNTMLELRMLPTVGSRQSALVHDSSDETTLALGGVKQSC